ncbi:MAG TPA: twin-arginine translocase TatA/TatE family subunit [Blastocatellia bacterium]
MGAHGLPVLLTLMPGADYLVILLIIVVLFGARRIPEAAKGLGEGIRNFKSALAGDDQPDQHEDKPVTK